MDFRYYAEKDNYTHIMNLNKPIQTMQNLAPNQINQYQKKVT